MQDIDKTRKPIVCCKVSKTIDQ